MPVVAAAAATAVTWISSAAAATTAFLASGLTAIGISSTLATTIAAGTLKLAASSLGAFALNAVLAPKVGTAGSPVAFKADPSSPIRGIMGRFGTGGTQSHMRVWGKNNMMISYAVILSLGPIQGVSKFTANDTQVNFTLANGLAAPVEPYVGKMWMTYKMGLPSDSALGPPLGVGGHPAMEWTANHRTSGYAGAFWTMQNNSKRASYEGGVPNPQWTVLGQKLYDPRKDSTQTTIGGAGTHRLNDWRTWEYSENNYVHALNWALGHHKKLADGTLDRRFLLAGVGADINSLHLPSFVAAANIADANQWVISGEWNTQDEKWQTFAAMLQAGSGVPLHVGAKIGVMINAPRAPVAHLTGADVIGNMNIKVMASRRDRFNTVYPRYMSEAQGWEYTTAGPVTSDVYRQQDNGQERPKEITYNFVRLSKQAGQLAAYDLANTRETLKLAFVSKPYLMGVAPGDAITITSEEHGLLNHKFLVMARPIDIMEGQVSMELRSESDEKHPWALGQADRPAASPGLIAIITKPGPPTEQEWVVSELPYVEGAPRSPGFVVSGDAADNVGRVIIEYAEVEWEEVPEGVDLNGLTWKSHYDGPPTPTTLEVNTPKANQWYMIGVTYVSLKGVPSDRKYYGPVNSGQLIAGAASDSMKEELDGIIESATQQIKLAQDSFNVALKQMEVAQQQMEAAQQQLNGVVTSANADFDRRLDALDTGLNGVQQVNSTQQGQIDGKAEQSSLTAVTNRVGTAESQIGSLNTTVAGLDGKYALATSYNTLASEVANARGTYNTLSGRFTAQQQALTDGLAGKASVTDLSSLQGRVTTAEGSLSAHNSRLSTVETNLSGKASASTLDSVVAEIVAARSGQPSLIAGIATHVNALVAADSALGQRIDTTQANINTEAGKVSALTTRMNTAETNIAGKASASVVESIQAEIVAARGNQPSVIANIAQHVNALVTADSALSTRIDTQAAEIFDARGGRATIASHLADIVTVLATADQANASAIQTVDSKAGDAQSKATTAVQTAAAADGKASAAITHQTDVNGVITGTYSVNNGVRTGYRIRSDDFEIVPSASTGARTSFANGKWTIWNAAGIDVVQLGLGVNG